MPPVNFDNCAEKVTLQKSDDDRSRVDFVVELKYGNPKDPSHVSLECTMKLQWGQQASQNYVDHAVYDLRSTVLAFAGPEGVRRIDAQLTEITELQKQMQAEAQAAGGQDQQ